MEKAGTPCPIGGLIGDDAADMWKLNPKQMPRKEPAQLDRGDWFEKLANGIIAVLLMALLGS